MKVVVEGLPEKKKGRLFIALGSEEVELLHNILETQLKNFPQRQYPQDWKRINQMRITLAEHTGMKGKPRVKTSEFPCPKCPAYLRDAKGIDLHLKTIHSGDAKPDPRTLNK